jgi:hypothetical protein
MARRLCTFKALTSEKEKGKRAKFQNKQNEQAF